MGQDAPRSMFQYLHDTGYGFLITGMHVKGQVVDSRGVSAWGYGGQTVERGDWVRGPHRPETRRYWPTDGSSRPCYLKHDCRERAHHDPLAYLQNRSVDWLDHQLAARELLELDPAITPLIVGPMPEGACRTGPFAADPAGIDRVPPPHRRGRRSHVHVAACWPGGHPRAGHRARAVPELVRAVADPTAIRYAYVVGTLDTKGAELACAARSRPPPLVSTRYW